MNVSIGCVSVAKTDDPCVTLINGVAFQHRADAQISAYSHRHAKVDGKSYHLVDGKWEEMVDKDAQEEARTVTATELFALFTKPKQEKPVFLRPYAARPNQSQ